MVKRLVPDCALLLLGAWVHLPLQKILYSDHAIIILYELQYRMLMLSSLSFLSSQWCSGTRAPRIPATLGSAKCSGATLTRTVPVGCPELHSQNESGAPSSMRVARTPFLAPRGVRASHDSYTRAHRVLRCPSDGLRVPRMVFWRANAATA